MQARGLLMIEHRLIEKMISLIKKNLEKVESTGEIDPVFVDTVVDFIGMYADRTHHGKEEDIMFQEMKKRSLSEEDQRIMNELIDEHVFGRQTTRDLIEANNRYKNNDESALVDIVDQLKILVDFYPKHIEKEDKVFFPDSRSYLTEEEDQAMLSEFREFDKNMIHEKYRSVVERLESGQY